MMRNKLITHYALIINLGTVKTKMSKLTTHALNNKGLEEIKEITNQNNTNGANYDKSY